MKSFYCSRRPKQQLSVAAVAALLGTISAVPQPVIAAAQINRQHRFFADDVTSRLYTEGRENECTSMWSVSLAFSLLYPSAVGDTAEQIRTLLRYPGDSSSMMQLVWNDTSTRIDGTYEGACADFDDYYGCLVYEPRVEIANRIWTDDQWVLNATYSQVVGDYVQQIDLDAPQAATTINEWVNHSTNGLIDSVLPDGPLTPAVIVAVNSIYFRASWFLNFWERRTNEDIFYTSPSRNTPVGSRAHFMHSVRYTEYSDTALEGFQILQLTLAASNLSVLFVLPMIESMDPAPSVDILEAVPSLFRTRVALALPKFKFTSRYEVDLEDALRDMGLTEPFSRGLCVFDSICESSIDAIIHETAIDVNEQGVEAAAVTVIMGAGSSPPVNEPVLFLADHPFQFLIYDSSEELVLFEGQVGNPRIASDALPAQFQASHSDPDFWPANFGGVLPEDVASQYNPPRFTADPSTVDPSTVDPSTAEPSTVVPPGGFERQPSGAATRSVYSCALVIVFLVQLMVGWF